MTTRRSEDEQPGPDRPGSALIGTGALLTWGGVAGVGVCLVLRYVEPAPRWDVLGCVAVSLLGVGLTWWGRRQRSRGGGEPTHRVPIPLSPPGFRLRGDWPVDGRQGSRLGTLLVLLAGLALLCGASSHVTPGLAALRGDAARLVPVTVAQVLERDSRTARGGGTTHTSELLVAEGRGGDDAQLWDRRRQLRGSVETADSVRPGDHLWALYVPGPAAGHRTDGETARGERPDPSALVLAEDREELEALRDGDTRPSPLLLSLVGVSSAGGVLLLLWRRPGTRTPGGVDPVEEALRTGNARALAVTVDGTGPTGRRDLGLGLRLVAEDGARELYLGRLTDVAHLAETLSACPAWLYWERPGDDRPPTGRPGRPGELLPAVLVLGDGGHLRGWTPRTPEWPVAQGRRFGPTTSESCPDTHPVGPGSLRRPGTRVTAVVCWSLAVACAAVPALVPGPASGAPGPEMAAVPAVLLALLGLRLNRARRRVATGLSRTARP